jgi:hypothetical protein
LKKVVTNGNLLIFEKYRGNQDDLSVWKKIKIAVKMSTEARAIKVLTRSISRHEILLFKKDVIVVFLSVIQRIVF